MNVEKDPAGLQGVFPGFVDRTPGPCHLGSHPRRLVILVGKTRFGRTRILLGLGCRRRSDLRFGGRMESPWVVATTLSFHTIDGPSEIGTVV